MDWGFDKIDFSSKGVKQMKTKYYYYCSYVARNSIFGYTTFDVKKKITSKNCMDTLKEVAKQIEENENLREIIIINFQELQEWKHKK